MPDFHYAHSKRAEQRENRPDIPFYYHLHHTNRRAGLGELSFASLFLVTNTRLAYSTGTVIASLIPASPIKALLNLFVHSIICAVLMRC